MLTTTPIRTSLVTDESAFPLPCETSKHTTTTCGSEEISGGIMAASRPGRGEGAAVSTARHFGPRLLAA